MAEMEAGEGSAEGSGAQLRGLTRGGAPAGEDVASFSDSSPGHPQVGAGNGWRDPNGSGNGSADVRATPVARRVAEATGVDLASVSGSGPGSKVTKEDVLAAGDGSGNGAAAASAGEEKQLRGPAAMLAKAMDESRAVPTATSFRTIAVDTLDAKRKAINVGAEGARVEGLLHPSRRLGDRGGDQRLPGDGADLRGARRQAVRDRGRPGQPRDRRRRREEGRLPQPDGAGDQGRPTGSTSPASTPTTKS